MNKTNPKIAIVHEYLTRMGGAERVVKVLSELFPQAPIYTLLYDAEKMREHFPSGKVVPSSLQKFPEFLRKRPRLLLPWITQAVEAWDFSEFDLVISSSSAFAHGLVLPLHVKHVCYCHSPARFLWDYSNEYLRDNQIQGFKRILLGTYLKNLRIWNRLSAHRVQRFVANSKTVQSRIQKYYRREADVIYPPVKIGEIKMGVKHDNYFLIVSQLSSYKRVDLAIAVFNKLRRRLVIVGDGPQRAYLQRIAGPTIEFLGWKTQAEVNELLRNCRGFIFPGEDDFGMAPVEAMAAGKPVLAYGKGGATETVIPRETGVLFREQTPESLENGLAELLRYEKKFAPPKIRHQAKHFSREVFEERMKKVVAQELRRKYEA